MLSYKQIALVFAFCALVGVFGCQTSPSHKPPSFDSILKFAWERTVAERRAGNWTFTEEFFKTHALAIAKFMNGEPPPNHKVIVRIGTAPDYPSDEREIHVIVFYDNGLTGHGYDFIFDKKMGNINGIMLLRGA